ncbi:MAG: hypothetical protein LBI36_03265, partial [Oscillospiraceae bacterium]|nr:hypothetical protein [Oscillospiraceae bacterium]
MLKRFIIGVFAAVTCAVSIITPTFRSHADSVEWDGKSEIKDGVVYTVTRELTVNGAVTVPKNAKLHVLADGSLKLTPKSKITVRGDFGVFKGATVLLSGELAVRPTGSLLVHGTLLASVSSVMNVNANMNIYADGVFKSSGVFKLYSERTLTNKGAFTLLKSGSVTVSGKIANAKNARFDVQG